MLKKYSKILIVGALLFIAMSSSAHAAPSWWPIVPCGLSQQPAGATLTDSKVDSNGKITQTVHDYTQPCNQCDLILLFKSIIDFVVNVLVPALGTLMFLVGGFVILFGARNGNSGGVATGKKIMTDTAIGIVIILCSWLIANFILKSLSNNPNNNTPWYQISCTVGTLKNLADATLPSVGGNPATSATGGTGGGTGAGSGSGAGTQCVFNKVDYATQNLCSGIQRPGGCGTNTCSQYLPSIQKYANGAATIAVLKSFMVVESDCDINAGSGTSFGLMQLTPQYAAPFAPQCGLTGGDITDSWLKTPANADKSVCLAAAYINGVSAGKCGNDPAHLYAGYNGNAAKACAPSVDCQQSCSGGQAQQWECPFQDTNHTQCNTGYYQTKQGSSYVNYCINHIGF